MRIRLTLASASPRRRELVKAFDLDIGIKTSEIEEGAPHAGELPEDYVTRLAAAKALQVAGRVKEGFVLGADTTVVLDGEVLGKPRDGAEAASMLRRLRGRVHKVITGIAVVEAKTGRLLSSAKSSDVHLRAYSDEEILAYVASGEPMDKAGAYAAQDEDFRPALKIVGCYTNVVGLPLCDVADLLGALGAGVELRRDWQAPGQCLECPLRATEKVAPR